jgi:putative hemolysin
MELLIVLFLILLNGVFAMAEIATVSAKKVRLEAAAKRGSVSAKTALSIAQNPSRFLSTVQIGITLIGILTGIYSGDSITDDLQRFLEGIPLIAPYAATGAVVITVVTLTYFAIVLGELVPKRIGMTYPETIARALARPMNLISKLVAPFVWLLSFSSETILKLLKIKSTDEAVTEEEIKAIVQESSQGGEIQQIEHEIVERVFNLGDRKVASLMTHKSDVITLDVHSDAVMVRLAVAEGLHSVYPVFEESQDNIIGVVSLKDLFDHIDDADFNLRAYLHPVQWVSSTTNAYHLLVQFKQEQTKRSLVTDEYGHLIGIITMSDIADALVGSVDEMYRDEFTVEKREDGSLLIDGHFPFHEFLRYFDIDEYASEYDINTMSGLVLEEMGRIPKASEYFVWHNFKIEVMDVDGAKIDKLLVTQLSTESDDSKA